MAEPLKAALVSCGNRARMFAKFSPFGIRHIFQVMFEIGKFFQRRYVAPNIVIRLRMNVEVMHE